MNFLWYSYYLKKNLKKPNNLYLSHINAYIHSPVFSFSFSFSSFSSSQNAGDNPLTLLQIQLQCSYDIFSNASSGSSLLLLRLLLHRMQAMILSGSFKFSCSVLMKPSLSFIHMLS